jgi:dinuclear metal center YbgI/SA1388 family protein
MSMRVRDIQDQLHHWAPRMTAMERDNVGIQCGDPEGAVRGILLCLDITEDIVSDALRKKANLVVSHHPLLYHSLKHLTPATHTERTLTALVRHDVAAIAAHTNLDAAPDGTSHALARVLGIVDPQTLKRLSHLQVKLTTFVPATHVDSVADAMSGAGAGIIGNYDRCSFRIGGTGTFRGNAGSSPAIGTRGSLEHVDEVRLEMVVERDRLPAVLDALRKTHPYEEVAYDVYPVENAHPRYGMGAIGDLPRPVSLTAFLRRVRNTLGTGALRFTGDPGLRVRRIAVCGGSGSDLLELAVADSADVLVTADIPFHRFQDAVGRIALVDAGHHETEYPVLTTLAARIREECRQRGAQIPVAISAVRTNPVAYV